MKQLFHKCAPTVIFVGIIAFVWFLASSKELPTSIVAVAIFFGVCFAGWLTDAYNDLRMLRAEKKGWEDKYKTQKQKEADEESQ